MSVHSSFWLVSPILKSSRVGAATIVSGNWFHSLIADGNNESL